MKILFNGLLEVNTIPELKFLIENSDKTNSIRIIEQALDSGVQKGIYSIEESYIIYLCLEKLKTNENEDK